MNKLISAVLIMFILISYSPVQSQEPDIPDCSQAWLDNPMQHFWLEFALTQAFAPAPEFDKTKFLAGVIGFNNTTNESRCFWTLYLGFTSVMFEMYRYQANFRAGIIPAETYGKFMSNAQESFRLDFVPLFCSTHAVACEDDTILHYREFIQDNNLSDPVQSSSNNNLSLS